MNRQEGQRCQISEGLHTVKWTQAEWFVKTAAMGSASAGAVCAGQSLLE